MVSCETSLEKSKKHYTGAPQDCQMQLFTSNLQIFELIRGSAGSARSGVGSRAWDLPSTRAGGQDDVSSKQTHSNDVT